MFGESYIGCLTLSLSLYKKVIELVESVRLYHPVIVSTCLIATCMHVCLYVYICIMELIRPTLGFTRVVARVCV